MFLQQPDPPGNIGIASQQQDQQQAVSAQSHHAQGQVSASQTADHQVLREENVIASQVSRLQLLTISQGNLPRL